MRDAHARGNPTVVLRCVVQQFEGLLFFGLRSSLPQLNLTLEARVRDIIFGGTA